MGNKPVKIGLRLDETSFEAGSVLSGRVYLSITSVQERATGVHLLLVGQELSVITRQEEESGRSHREASVRREERSTTSLVHLDVPLTTFQETLEPGQYEYPFEWELPMDLPSTMQCRGSSDSHCSVSYQLTAYLYTGPSSGLWDSVSFNKTDYSHTLNLCVNGKSFETIPKPLSIPEEDFPIRHCCSKKGIVKLGFETESSMACPNSALRINILGGNESAVRVQHLKVQWMESIDWNARGYSEHVERCLDESIVPIDALDEWHAQQQHAVGRVRHARRNNRNSNAYSSLYTTGGGFHHHMNSATNVSQPLQSQLHIPADARDSYQGRLISVRHTLVVKAVTEGHCCITSPESCALVQIQRKPLMMEGMPAAATTSASAAVTEEYAGAATVTTTATAAVVEPSAPYEGSNDVYAQASILPEDWSAQTADVITLTVPSATVLEDATGSPSAPVQEGTVLSENNSSNTMLEMQQALAQSQHPLQLVNEHWISNPLYVTELQNATPHDFVRLLQSIQNRISDIPAVARTMALMMDYQFTCNHVLAALWALPSYLRFEVLHEVAPLASDLSQNQHYLEQQLNANELLHFRAALK